MKFQEVQFVGSKFVDHFETPEKLIERRETTRVKMDALKNKNAISPKKTGRKWTYSGVDNFFDTTDGLLSPGKYAVIDGVFCGMMSTGKYEEADTLEELYAKQAIIDNQHA